MTAVLKYCTVRYSKSLGLGLLYILHAALNPTSRPTTANVEPEKFRYIHISFQDRPVTLPKIVTARLVFFARK